MSRWFRHYAGMMRDPKLVGVAARTKQPVERVAFVWGCILEDAAEARGCGTYTLDIDEVAYFLRCESDDIAAIHMELAKAGLVKDGVIIQWAERQFETDRTDPTNADRQRRFRQKNKTVTEETVMRNGDVTDTKRPETETETDISSLRSDTASAPDERFELFWSAYPKRSGSNPKPPAKKSFQRALKRAAFEEIMAGVQHYAGFAEGEDPRFVKQATTWLNQDCWTDRPINSPNPKTTGARDVPASLSSHARNLGDRIAAAQRGEPLFAIGGDEGGGNPVRMLPDGRFGGT